MRLILMLIPYAALGGLASVAPEPPTSEQAFGQNTGYWRSIID